MFNDSSKFYLSKISGKNSLFLLELWLESFLDYARA